MRWTREPSGPGLGEKGTTARVAARFTAADAYRLLPHVVLAVLFALYCWQVAWVHRTVGGPRSFHDTNLYLSVAKNGFFSFGIWGGERPPLATLLFKACSGDLARVCLVQTSLSVLGFGALALALNRRLRSPLARVASSFLVFSLALSPDIAQWNEVMMSESISLSFGALTVATGLMFTRRPRAWVAPLILAAAAFALSRDGNAYVILWLAPCVAGVALLSKLRARPWVEQAVVALAFVAVFAASNASANWGKRWQYPLVNVVVWRVLLDHEVLRAFEDMGMPYSRALHRGRAKHSVIDTEASLAPFRTWLETKGKSAYFSYLLRHPRYTFGQPEPRFRALFDHDVSAYRPKRFPISSSRWDVALWSASFWLPRTIALVALGVLGLALDRARVSPAVAVGGLSAVLAYPHALLAWHADTMELVRHGFGASVQLELAFLLLSMGALDAALSRLRAASTNSSQLLQK